MQRNYVLTLTGPDRIGIVHEVTGLLLARGGNVTTSRMVRLGGEFAVLMLVSLPSEPFDGLDVDLASLTAQGYKITTTVAEHPHAEVPPGWLPYRIEVQGADHEGIIHEVSQYLSQNGVNIESIDSETTPAPTTGSPLFAMTAHVVIPPSLSVPDWEAGLEKIGVRLNVEIDVFAMQNA
ncbi:glycine cleavage system protein R [Singulisphaera acidiphila]|uniref:Glycine cleavage system regulatory protein n=1 Tax=Singulisphaera acidiphila (strain ATCC BAA-1392 / DSM 18658 / VKM B-2454 / MOB10) TaxID=886293 RepID=L0DQL7_SINAD|nr:ACT domain-containing protein [Singulisphaera acidiphila]AGA31225.1 glycine cleavage system regulatory protein [Singulisphaera acidiphila DSM 18658]